MRASRILALCLALLFCMFLAGCGGGGGSKPAPAGPPTITSTTLTQATVNVPYSFYLNATGGTGTYTWSISAGSLPPGLMFSDMTAQIYGTPTTAGKYQFTAKVTDSNNLSGTANLTLTVGGVILITCNSCSPGTMNLPAGNPGVAYSASLSASGGVAPYTWCVLNSMGMCDATQAELPAGLSLNASTGVISGTPTTPQAPMQFTVQATDSETPPSVATAQLTIAILGITTSSLPSATINQPYSQSMTVAGGMPTYTWAITVGQLPAGLSLSPGSCMNTHQAMCVITGTPTQLGVSNFTAQVTDSETPPGTATAQLSIDVHGPTLSVTTTTLPNGTIGLPYSGVVQAMGGIPPLTWSLASGSLPAGLSLTPSNGDIAGMPTGSGMSSFVVQVQDNEQPPQIALSQTLAISVNPGISDALLHGNYAFALNGYNSGNPFVMAAAFVADGNGNITGGYLDLNDGSGEISSGQVVPQIVAPGSMYDLNADGTGTMTIMTTKPATYQFSISVSANACAAGEVKSTCGQVIERDPSNPQNYGSGELKVQDSQYFQVSAFFPGNFALLVTGTDPTGHRYGAAGALGTNPTTLVDIDCNGNGWHLSECPLDVDDNAQVGPDPLQGTFSATIDPGTGRGQFVDLSFPSDPNGICLGTISSPHCNYAYYIIDREEMILISADPVSKPANLTLWSGFRQLSSSGGWTLMALNGSSVVELSAVDPNGGSPLADVTAGFLNADGAGNGTLNTDENDGGILYLRQSSQGTYSIDSTGQNTGKVTFSGFSTQFGATPPVLYLYSGNFGFFVGTDAKVTSGILEPQSGSPFNNVSVEDVYAGGTHSPVLSGVTNSVTYLFADGLGDITATQYTSGSGGPGGPNNLTLTYSVDDTGRAIVLLPDGHRYGNLYVVSPNKFILLPVGDDPALNIFASGPVF